MQALVTQRMDGKAEETLKRLNELAEKFPYVILIHFEIACTQIILNRRRDALFGFQAFLSTLSGEAREEAEDYLARLRIFPNNIEEPFAWHEY